MGTSVWGDDNGSLRFTSVEKLCEAFPNAARQLEDLMIAGCYSQSLRQVDKWRARFPNLHTFWAYGSSAPGSVAAATTPAHESKGSSSFLTAAKAPRHQALVLTSPLKHVPIRHRILSPHKRKQRAAAEEGFEEGGTR